MEIRLGNKIKQLRKQKNISQEVLANYLGVTFQAVSKWENGATMPDVMMIPAIASFFGVSTDELFDFNLYEIEKKVMEICEESWKVRDDDPARAEEILREGLKKYPGNDIILNNMLCVMKLPERAEEAIELCQALAAGTEHDDVRYDAYRFMAMAYKSIGEYAQCKAAIEKIPELYFTKLELDAELLEGGDMFESANRQKIVSADSTIDMLLALADYYEKNGEADKAAIQLGIAKNIINAFRGDFEVEFFEGTFFEGHKPQLDEIEKRISQLS